MLGKAMTEIQGLVLSTSYNLRSTLFLLGLVGVLTIAYALRLLVKGRPQYARVDKQGGSALLSKGVMEMAYWWLQPVGKALVACGVTPNMISWASLVFGLLAGICLAFGHFGFGGGFALLSGFLDSLDGMVARLTGTSSEAGEVLDATVDRYAEAFFIGGLVIYYRDLPILQVLAMLALMGSFMVSYSSAKAEALQVTPPKGSMRRPERAVYLTLGAVLSPISIAQWEYVRDYPIAIGFPMVFALGLIAVLANASAIERMAAIAKVMRVREAEELRRKSLEAEKAAVAEEAAAAATRDPARTR
jgi:CDP-diacylglycerol--glycerol-3-phosphate 3-phosphatidyltransferase